MPTYFSHMVCFAPAGLASEDALLDWPALALRCGRPEAALAAAGRAAAAMPRSAALHQQLLVLQAQQCTMQVPPSPLVVCCM
jgi:hypothetical protein